MYRREKAIKPQSHLLNILASLHAHNPQFTLFLGAGASVRSGVRSASSLIADWRTRHATIFGPNEEHAAAKLNEPDEYAYLFEALYDHPSQRRNFIESCIQGATPSWGYIYLVNLIQAKVFNTIFTTNFDDLLNEACFAYSTRVRPVVCAHDSSISNVRIFAQRPKIVKLHGDFLFDSIRNTELETKTLENNMKEKFKQYAAEFGMIVIGYAGNDRSVMDPLETLLESGSSFPTGVYWCVRKGSRVSKYVDRLSKFDRFNLVEIEGFDEFCADVHNLLGLSMQPELSDPYGALTQKLDGLMRRMNLGNTGPTHPVIERDMRSLAEQLMGLAISEKGSQPSFPVSDAETAEFFPVSRQMPVPFVFLANFFLRRGETKRAHMCVAAALNREPSKDGFDVAFRSLRLHWDEKFYQWVVELLTRSMSIFEEPGADVNDYALEMLNAGKFKLAAELLQLSDQVGKTTDMFHRAVADLNRAQLFRHRGETVPPSLVERAQEIDANIHMPAIYRLGGAIILEKWTSAWNHLQVAMRTDPASVAELPTWPIAALLIPHLPHPEIREAFHTMRDDHLAGRVRNDSLLTVKKIVHMLKSPDQ